MTFTLSEEQRLLKDAARDFFQDQAPVSRLRKLRDEKKNGRDPDLWREMAAMGWAGIIVPEAFGGSGLGYVGMGLVLEQAGRTLTASPLHSSALTCASALLLAGTQAQKERWLPKIATGEAIGALAVDEGAHHAPDKSTLKVSGGKISGAKSYVAEGHIADLFIVVGGDGLYLVRSDAKGMRRRELLTVDSRGAADLTFDDADAERMEGGAVAIDAVLDRARIGLAAEMLGQAQEAFEITSEYLKTRKQFGRLLRLG